MWQNMCLNVSLEHKSIYNFNFIIIFDIQLGIWWDRDLLQDELEEGKWDWHSFPHEQSSFSVWKISNDSLDLENHSEILFVFKN